MPNTETILETDRVRLRPLTLEDAETLAAVYAEPGVLRYFGNLVDPQIDAVREQIRKILWHHERFGLGLWATESRASGELIGRCGLIVHVLDGEAIIEVAYLLSARFWRQGYATEIASALRDLARQRFGVKRLNCIMHIDNVGSWRVAEKIGLSHIRDTMYRGMPVRLYAAEL